MKHKNLILLTLLSGYLAGCSSNVSSPINTIINPSNPASTNHPHTSAVLPSSFHANDSNILIAYFTWADNTYVVNPDEVDFDASTSASVLAPGNAAIVANYIHNQVGGTLFSIKVADLYSSDYDECLDRASEEKAQNARPQLKTTVENMDSYDVIFLGFPNWWYTVPMAIYSFLESYDLSGKTIIPFCVHGTSGLASTIRDIQSALDEDVNFVTNAFHVYRPDTVGCEPDVKEWIEEIGFQVS